MNRQSYFSYGFIAHVYEPVDQFRRGLFYVPPMRAISFALSPFQSENTKHLDPKVFDE